jgi:hypothetical protein
MTQGCRPHLWCERNCRVIERYWADCRQAGLSAMQGLTFREGHLAGNGVGHVVWTLRVGECEWSGKESPITFAHICPSQRPVSIQISFLNGHFCQESKKQLRFVENPDKDLSPSSSSQNQRRYWNRHINVLFEWPGHAGRHSLLPWGNTILNQTDSTQESKLAYKVAEEF